MSGVVVIALFDCVDVCLNLLVYVWFFRLVCVTLRVLILYARDSVYEFVGIVAMWFTLGVVRALIETVIRQ